MLPNPDYKARGPKHTARGQRELSFGLCLSGGGFRATLFQLGMMMGLHRVGLLERVDAISAVSGGSILAATYGLARSRAAAAGRTFDFIGFVSKLDAAIARGVRNQALARLANPTFFLRWLSKGATRTDLLAEAYDRVFFEGATLSDLPASPAILLNTTCLNNGQQWTFSREGFHGISSQMILKGEGHKTNVPLSVAVAASTAVPGLFPPITRSREVFFEDSVDVGFGFVVGFGDPNRWDRMLSFCDGGVVDNTGYQALIYRENPNVSLICDGGAPFSLLESPPRSLVLGYLPGVGRLLFGGAGVMGRVIEIMMFHATADSTDRMEPDDPWRIHKYSLDIDSAALNGLSHDVVREVCRIRTDLDGFSDIERRALMLHGESHVYHYLQLQRANGFGPVMSLAGSEVPTIENPGADWETQAVRHLTYAGIPSSLLRGVIRLVLKKKSRRPPVMLRG